MFTKIQKYQIALDNRELRPPERDVSREKLRVIFVSGFLSAILIITIVLTMPMTILSLSGLIVYSSIVSLVIFLFVLLIRYFAILFMAYFYITRYTVQSKPAYYPFISIIVPVYNEGKILRSSIESLLDIDYPNYEIIIVNDGSTDNSAAVGEELIGYHKGRTGLVKISLINKPNGGKSKALNAGIQYSDAPFVLCMDGDSQLTPNTLKLAMRHFVDPAVGAVAGNVKVQNRKMILTDLQALEYLEGLNLARSAQGYIQMVNIIPGPIGVFRKVTLRDAGFYSSDTYAEDADITLKILSKGWKIIYEPNAIAYTEAPATIHQLLKQRYRWTRGIVQAIRKHKRYLYNPTLNFNNSFIMWAMFYEALVWPAMHIFVNIYFIFVALFYGIHITLFLWWVGIAVLDLMSAVYCIAAEKEEFRLVPYAIFYRLFFILLIDVTKVMATIEEFLGVRMTWGKLERTGPGGYPIRKTVLSPAGVK